MTKGKYPGASTTINRGMNVKIKGVITIQILPAILNAYQQI
jgi:hypothetical protein